MESSESLRFVEEFGPTHLAAGLRKGTELAVADARKSETSERVGFGIVSAVAISMLLASYVGVFLTMIRDIRDEERRTKGMLLLIPAHIIAANFNIREYLMASNS